MVEPQGVAGLHPDCMSPAWDTRLPGTTAMLPKWMGFHGHPVVAMLGSSANDVCILHELIYEWPSRHSENLRQLKTLNWIKNWTTKWLGWRLWQSRPLNCPTSCPKGRVGSWTRCEIFKHIIRINHHSFSILTAAGCLPCPWSCRALSLRWCHNPITAGNSHS
jgi:hypothetical protein